MGPFAKHQVHVRASDGGYSPDIWSSHVMGPERMCELDPLDVPLALCGWTFTPDHYIVRSNEAEVLRAMNDFLGKLPQQR